MALPNITITSENTITGLPEDGDLLYRYAPFKNLNNSSELSILRLPVNKSGIDIKNHLELISESAYDDSTNIIISDNINPPKIVNSRFSLKDSKHYKIADRRGNLDTNIYTIDNFKSETSLVKTVNSIISVDYIGIFSGGKMPVGNYSFYFKLADSDGNESDFIAESGKVVCFVGTLSNPKSIRGGLANEDSGKLIKLRLNDLDLAYDFINVYYTRSTGNESESVLSYKILDKFKISSNNTEISITGYEDVEEISIQDINIQYTQFDSVKSLETCQNINFAGNITNDYETYKLLEKYSLFITPEVATSAVIGNIRGSDYGCNIGSYEYYNPRNIYSNLGYWDEEIYRFGIVYIMNNYTLSPVFNIRGRKTIGGSEVWTNIPITQDINYGEDYIIEGTDENIKGVFKIDFSGLVFSGENPIRPIGIKFNFDEQILSGSNDIRTLTKGFFIVRQKRIPSIITQALGGASFKNTGTPTFKYRESPSSNSFLGESFLSEIDTNKYILKSSFFGKDESKINKNLLFCPEANLRPHIFQSLFNKSSYNLKVSKYVFKSSISSNALTSIFARNGLSKRFYLPNLFKRIGENVGVSEQYTDLLYINPGIELISNNLEFSSKAGDASIAYKYLDVEYGDYADVSNTTTTDENFTDSPDKIRGEFNGFVGVSSNTITPGVLYNIFEKGYNFEVDWKNYFRIRANDSSPFFAVSDRFKWNKLSIVGNKRYSPDVYRGDCYICTYTHKMNWNFIDPELPTNTKIVDPYTWYKNFKIVNRASTTISGDGEDLNIDVTSLTYRKLLENFTYKDGYIPDFSNSETENTNREPLKGIIEPDGKKYKKYVENNGLFGASQINRPDVNAVDLGHYITFKICSNINLSLRDVDFSNPQEEAIHRQKRTFYPFGENRLPESSVINPGISKTIGDKYHFEIPDVPFIKTNFSNRIYYSNPLINSTFIAGNRIFQSKNYQDYTLEYGALTKLVEWYGTLIAIMEHGILMIPVNERAMMKNESGENVYINTDSVLPKNPRVLSNTYGSKWITSIVKTQKFIYGIDTVGKKIWRTNGENFELISDLKIQKFLNDNMNLKTGEELLFTDNYFIKSHFNSFKSDVIFTFKSPINEWSLCWNEVLNKWVTRYTWFPEFSENINNIFYTFANRGKYPNLKSVLFKHGFAGTEEELGNIQPTKWYDEQQPFEFEFVVVGVQGIQKIFDNLKIISNSTEPNSFYFEVVGEGFGWNEDKSKIYGFKGDEDFKNYLLSNLKVKKIPDIKTATFDNVDAADYFFRDRGVLPNNFNMSILKDLTIRENNKTREKLVNIYQKGADIKKFGRLKGNMQYVEDSWDIQIQPITFKYGYLSGGNLVFSNNSEMKIRDKYIKIRIKYDGSKYAIINAIRTMFTLSYA